MCSHLPTDLPAYTGFHQGRQIINSADCKNRLAASNSPYLLQHAHNPVDWHEWSSEAFAKAKEQNRLIFLSIGYSTCHWCHVMERESFEDEEVAALINSAYVAIKVDREQRPDIDQIYMDVCQALTGTGGWPLTLVLTPDQKPIFAGTYFSKRQKHGRPGLIEILSAIAAEWKLDSQKFLESAEQISAHFGRSKVSATRFPDEEIVTRGVAEISAGYDPLHGGFTSAPKFPMGHVLELLLNYSVNTADSDLLARVEHSLLAMYQGGIFDHVGGGFCRYSTDERWLVPHFEKMLYDNALLLRLYAAAYKATGKVVYKEVAEAVSAYVVRDLKSSGAGFYSAEDADSKGHEGKFYVFSYDEFMQLAGEDNATLLAEYFGVTSAGNFEDGQNILHLRQSPQEYCARHALDGADFSKKLEEFRQKLFACRSRRIRPALDDKVITSWNGLMIGALAMAGRYLGRSDLIESAQHAAAFIKKNLIDSQGRLLRCWRHGKAEIDGFFEDYAFLVQGLLELFRSDYNPAWLQWAIALQNKVAELFADSLPGSYFETARDAEKLLFRPQNLVDGAVPCARAVFADNCVMLASITGNNSFVDMATAIFADAADLMVRAPSATAVMLNALRRYYHAQRIIILTDKLSEAEDFVAAVEEFYLPDSVVLVCANQEEETFFKTILDDSQIFASSRPVIQICRKNACLAPVRNREGLIAALRELRELSM